MKKIFVLMNHNILESQINEAKEVLGAGDIVVLSDSAWSRIDPYKKAIADDLLPYKERLKSEAQKGDYLLVQGDFGATYNMARYALKNGVIAIYATTERNSVEKIIDGRVVTTREFVHVRFREYKE